jgi:hypothetical protein
MPASEIPNPLSEVRAWADHLLPAGAETARIVGRAEAGVVLTRGGDVLRSQGCPTTACWRQASRPV